MPAAAGLVLDETDRVLLVRKDGDDGWSLPGGMMELGERIDRTVVTEIAEQTGLGVESVQLVGVYSDSRAPVCDPQGNRLKQVTALFNCRITGGVVGPEAIESTRARFSL
jgi:ADP-ribose pyrophosphatase YjhB (NUDIX family)